ncbi:DUF1488 family protein [Bradyrhizobium roseum]|uniref:DUF1488 family protein n=1 Tax=Bradyrhizobium roseum TaxID=3056648 RepID=UPI0026340243|nr:DUF1488 family protein [Bradyrhizobium roseus]WKA26833.1 DUF1488 family protein [Bradyrhizobium roseus]
MPLTRDRIIGHDTERLAFRFTMLNGGDTVECQISDAAMDELGGTRGTESRARQAQFLALRDTVEGVASEMFDRVPVVKGRVIRIFTKHVQKSPPSPAERIGAGTEPDAENAASLRLIVETRPANATR